MNILDLILSRRTIHSFTSEHVPKAVIERALLAAIHAPNHKQTWPWRFYYIGPKTREKFAELNVRLKVKRSKTAMSEAAKKSVFDQFMVPGALILACIKKSNDLVRLHEDYASMSCALQNMALCLESEGYGSKWGTGEVMRADETYNILNISRDEFEICGLFWIGKPQTVPSKPERPPVSEFLVELE